jgi:subtilisin family serine protease
MNGGYQTMSGTSMATPGATGSIALLLAAKKELIGKVDEVEKLMRETAKPMNFPKGTCDSKSEHPNNVAGWGFADCYKASGFHY